MKRRRNRNGTEKVDFLTELPLANRFLTILPVSNQRPRIRGTVASVFAWFTIVGF